VNPDNAAGFTMPVSVIGGMGNPPKALMSRISCKPTLFGLCRQAEEWL